MNVGFCALYSWRPHVEHLFYLSKIVEECGYKAKFLTCDSDLNYCYTKALRENRSEFIHCLRCRAGGIRSFVSEGVTAIGDLLSSHKNYELVDFSDWACSSASTLGRFESNSDYESPEFIYLKEKLAPEVGKAYYAALQWIKEENLTSICIFNGRMDITRGVVEAAKSAGINYVTIERSWFGDGIQILPGEDCLGLKNIHELTKKYKNKYLTMRQAEIAGSYIAARFLRKNNKEWRAYNLNAKNLEWTIESPENKRVLILPSSRNEVINHKDWTPEWSEPAVGFESIINILKLNREDILLRGHPNWAEKIGLSDGSKIEKYYQDWSSKLGVKYIPSENKTSTQNLIEQCDFVLTNGGTAAIEAAILGKPVISIAPSVYQAADFTLEVHSKAHMEERRIRDYLENMNSDSHKQSAIRSALRFTYCMANRVPQYFDYVKSTTTTKYAYYEGASPEILIHLLNGNSLVEGDDSYAESDDGERMVVLKILSKKWGELYKKTDQIDKDSLQVRRKILYRPIDGVRNLFKRGDL